MQSTYRSPAALVDEKRTTAAALATLILLILLRMRFPDTPLLLEEE